jgi:hypothetical protein
VESRRSLASVEFSGLRAKPSWVDFVGLRVLVGLSVTFYRVLDLVSSELFLCCRFGLCVMQMELWYAPYCFALCI